jgi:hypothetical protein
MIDLTTPTTAVATDARDVSRSASPGFLFNHACRTFAWALAVADLDSVGFDRELLYVAALLHDLGLTTSYDGPRCFEHESAAAAGAFARRHGWNPDRCELLANAIRLHMQPRVVPEDGAEGYLLSQAASCDVSGHRIEQMGDIVDEVVGRFPWLDFVGGFVDLFADQARRKPGCLADLYLQRGLADRVRNALKGR